LELIEVSLLYCTLQQQEARSNGIEGREDGGRLDVTAVINHLGYLSFNYTKNL
jgi:hypothetical protein